METKLRTIVEKYEQLTAQMNDPSGYSDPAVYARLAKEQKELAPLVEAWRRWEAFGAAIQEAEAAMEDPELRELAAEELRTARQDREQTAREIELLLLPKDPNDGRNVILEIRAGIGGEEAALFAADLYRMYTQYATRRGWRMETVSGTPTELGGWKELICALEGPDVWSRLKFEAGGHCVKRVPETESSGRIQTSTATVAVLPEVEDVEFTIDPGELRIDTFRSSGAGGQKVNKTESAIRITHLPTGTVVECQDERSQYKNKDRAMRILRARLYGAAQAKQDAAVAARRKDQVGTGERSEKIRTYFFLRGFVTDHRLTGEGRTFALNEVLGGDLDALTGALIRQDQAAKLAGVGGDTE